MIQIQSKVGVRPDGVFGPMTANAIKNYYKLNPEQAAHLLGQCHAESNGFTVFKENLNYSFGGLMKYFPRYFTQTEAMQYARRPEMIANRTYANRMGNGPESSGDGWKFRGRGAIQLTGKNNYQAFAKYADNLEIFCKPELVETQYPLESAMFYFNINNVWQYCGDVSEKSIMDVSQMVNLGGIKYVKLQDGRKKRVTPNGLDHRRTWTYKIYDWLK